MAVAMTDQTTQRTPSQELVEWVRSDERRSQIALALPDGVSIERFERATVTALLAKPELAKADRASLYLALLNAAQAGLVPDGKKSAIVVYGDKAQFLPMVSGVRDTLAEFGWVARTGLIYANDEFDFDEGEARITHRRVRPGMERGDFQGAWAAVLHKDGVRREAVVMTKAEIDYVRDHSSKSRKVWDEWYPQMCEKTPLHRLAKKVGLDPKDRERIDFIVNTDELEPGEAATMLYGNRALVARDVGALSEGEQGTSHVPPADSENTAVGGQGASTDGTPAAADLHDDEPVPGEPAEDAGEPEIIDEGEDEQARQLADSAAMFIPPNGQYAQTGKLGPKSLSEILATGDDGERWLKWALEKITAPQDYCDAVQRFTRVYLPTAYQEALARKQAAS